MANPYLPRSLRTEPRIRGVLLRRANPDVFDTKTDPDRVSFREAVAHVADLESVMLDRFRQAKTESGSALRVVDEDELALANTLLAHDTYHIDEVAAYV